MAAVTLFVPSKISYPVHTTLQSLNSMKEKQTYFSPESEALEMRPEGVIAASGDPQDYNNPFGGGEY